MKERLTQERIEAIRKRLGDATPGTWGSGKVPGTIVAAVTDRAVEESGVTQEVLDRYGGLPVAADVGEADREFICQAKEDIGRLLEMTEEKMPSTYLDRAFHLLDDLIRETADLLRGHQSGDHYGYRRLCVTFMSKTVTSLQAVKILVRRGLDIDALVLARTMVESAIALSYIGLKPDARTSQFMAREASLLLRARKTYSSVESADLSRLDDLIRQEEEEAGFTLKSAATGEEEWPTVPKMAKEAGLGPLYIHAYMVASRYVHPQAIALDEYLQPEDGHLVARLGSPSTYHLARAVLASGTAMMLVIQDVIRAFNLHSDHLQRILHDVNSALEQVPRSGGNDKT